MAGHVAECSNLPTKAEKIEYLRKHDTRPLRAMLCMALDPTIEWELPDSRPPFEENKTLFDQEDMLYNEMKRMYLFLKGPNKIFGDEHNPNVRPIRREQLFIQLLESLQADDAELVLSALEKKLPQKGLTARIINEAYPGLITILEKVKDEVEA
jgi:uncharacterized protein DUF6433